MFSLTPSAGVEPHDTAVPVSTTLYTHHVSVWLRRMHPQCDDAPCPLDLTRVGSAGEDGRRTDVVKHIRRVSTRPRIMRISPLRSAVR